MDEAKKLPFDLKFISKIRGDLFGDKGYISQNLFDKLYGNNLILVTLYQKNMNNKLLDLWKKSVCIKTLIN